MARTWRLDRLLVALAMLVVVAVCAPSGQASAQQSATGPAAATVRLDADKAGLDAIEAQLTRADIPDAKLQQLRGQVDPIAVDIQAVITDLQPRLEAAKARVAQLGPKPDPKAAAPTTPEAADITSERAAQEKLLADLDATVKRARVLQVQAGQLDTTIGGMRRALFTRSVLAQSYSLLDPRLWTPVIAELPSDWRAISYLAQDWYNGVASKLAGWQLALVAGVLVLVIVLYEPAQRVGRRVAARDETGKQPGRLRKYTRALWVVVVTVTVPGAALAIAGFVLFSFDLITPRLALLAGVFTRVVVFLALIIGLARGFLAPRRPSWRIPLVSDTGAERLYRVTFVVAGLVGVTRIVEALNDTISAGLPTAIASRGVLTALVAAGMAVTLQRLNVEDDDTAKAAKARKAKGRDWTGPLRLIFWALIVVMVGGLLSGFIAFASFLAVQIVVVSAIGTALILLLGFADEGCAALFDGNRAVGRSFIHNLGVKRDSLDLVSILLAGAIRVVLISIALLLALAPWRIESGDMLSTLQAAVFGFSIGDVTISLTSIALAVVLFLAAIAITHAVQRWLEGTFLPRTRLDTGLQNSIKTSLGYIGFIVAAALSLSQLGVSFERLAIVAGALSVGIGFGLQSIVNNFVSGLILLWERVIRVGDWIVVGDEQGYVRRINVRSTEIETFDRATVVVPNSNLVSGVVKNWLRNDHVGRIRLPFVLGFNADPDKVREVLIATAKDNEHVLSIPSPQVLLTAVGESNMRLELVCFLDDVEATQRVTSELLFAAFRAMKQIGLYGAPGPASFTTPIIDKIDAWLTQRIEAGPPGDRKAAAE